jgi:aminopeptidase N
MKSKVSRVLKFWLLVVAVVSIPGARLHAAPLKQAIQVNGYVIDVTLNPADHTLKATARVAFVALDNVDQPEFEFNGALKLDKITDDKGHLINGERGQNATVRVTPAAPLQKGDAATYSFDYEGTLSGEEESPVTGLKLAAISDPITYLLYPARWFPMVGYLTDRFTADITVHIPAGYRVIGSGAVSPSSATSLKTAAPKTAGGDQVYQFNWDRPGFPGTIVAGKFVDPTSISGAANIRVFTTSAHKEAAAPYAQVAAREFDFFTGSFGPAETPRMNIVEIPNDTVPSFWAPEMALIAGSRINDRTGSRLLANTLARQWWGNQVSPATLGDGWITNGMARYAELMYIGDVSGQSALSTAVTDISASALAYDTIPLTAAGRLDPFSVDYQSMTFDKGAMVFHMLRFEIGDEIFTKTLQTLLTTFKDKPVRTSDVEKTAEAASQQNLTPFFAQWLDGTGAPEFQDKYAVYRLGNGTGFRTIGEVQQDLDLFNMPVELEVQTEGKTEKKKVQVVGTDSQYVIDTFGRPRNIVIDPDNEVLKNSPDLQVKIAILRGQNLVAQGDLPGALDEFQKALAINSTSSLANYRIGDLLFTQRNYQASANAFRDAIRGDNDPRWTEVWSHVRLGNIFDVTGQRERAINEYREAVQTNDNTQGAVNAARQYLQKAYQREEPGQ